MTGLGAVADAEKRYPLVHSVSLMLQRLCGRGIFLDQRRVLLGHLVHLRQSFTDLLDAARLLGGGIGDVGNDVGDLLDR